MTTKTDTDQITATERRELRAVVRNQMAVLRKEVQQREGALTAEMERRLVERYQTDDTLANKFKLDAKKLTAETNAKFAKLKERYGELFNGGQWSGRDEYYTPSIYRRTEDREQLRRALAAGIKSELHNARVALDRQEADLLKDLALDALKTSAARAFLERLPTAIELMPAEKLREIEARYDASPQSFR